MKEDFDHIKKRLRDYESPINLDEAWGAMQELQQKRRGKWKRKSSVLLLLLLIGSCGACWLLGKRAGQNLESPAGKGVSAIAPLQTNLSVEKDKPLASHSAGNTIENATLTQTEKHFATSTPLISQGSPETGNSLASQTLTLLNQPTGSNDNTQKTNILNNSALGISSPAATPSRTPESPHASGNISSAVMPESDRENSDNGRQQSKAGNDSTRALPTPPPFIRQQWVWMDVLPEKVFGMAVRPPQAQLTLPVVQIGLSHTRPARKTPVRKSLYLSCGAVLAQQQFKARTIEQAEYAFLRSASETSLPGLSADLGIALEVSPRNYVDVALRYDMWYDQFVYQYEQAKEYNLTNVLLGVVQYEPIGTEVRVYGDTVISGTQTVKATYFNRYSAADLRLAFGHSLWEGHRFSLNLTAGMSANIYKKVQGHIADSGQANGVTDLQYTPYKQTLGLGVYADFRLNYRLTSRLDIQLKPSTIFGLSDALRSGAPTGAHFRRTSLQLGLSTRF